MTAAVYRSETPSLSVPQTQNTAPVLEFSCLYTHDIRRKQKRWQDGFLRFHTFNKRVMVYDVPRNLVGDTHWKANTILQDGDELTLEREGVMVQVAESVGRTETDLTELRRSKKKTASEAGSSSPARGAPSAAPHNLNINTSNSNTQLKHRSLNALLGTPKAPIGKAALPAKSPFEERYRENQEGGWNVGRPAKRMRMEPPSAWNVTRTTTTTPARPLSKKETPLGARTSDSAKQRKRAPPEAGQLRLGTKEVIDLSADTDEQEKFLDGFSSDALAPPSSPPKEQCPAKEAGPVRSSSPAFQRQRTPESDRKMKSAGKPKVPETSHGAQTRGSAKSAEVDVHIDDKPPSVPKGPLDPLNGYLTQQPREDHNTLQHGAAQSIRLSSGKPGKTLRMSASVPKKRTLLCQDQSSKKPARVHSANTENAIDVLLDVTSQDPMPNVRQPRNQRLQLEDRLARIDKKRGINGNEVHHEAGMRPPLIDQSNQRVSGARPQTPLRDSALELARLDQMIMPREHPPSPEVPPVPASVQRQLRRVVSEANNLPSTKSKRPPGAPVRYTPSPVKKSPTPHAEAELTTKQPVPITAAPAPIAPPKTKVKKAMQRSVSLNTASNGTSTVILGRPFQASKAPVVKAATREQVADPWSREAFDLFTWRPPGWDEENWCLKVEDVVVEVST